MAHQVVIIDKGDPETIGADALMAALVELRTAWREDNGVFSVRVMCAVGAVITETEAVIDFDTPAGSET